MSALCGQIEGRVGDDGRLKLPAEWKGLFLEDHAGQAVLVMLPEGCLALWPRELWTDDCAEVFRGLRAGLPGSVGPRELTRLSGAFRRELQIDGHGRIRVPETFRRHGGIEPGQDVVLVGAESRVEIWDPNAWEQEQARLWQLTPAEIAAAAGSTGGGSTAD